MAVSQENCTSFELFSPNVKELFERATNLPANENLSIKEIQEYIDFNDFTFNEEKLERILEVFLAETVGDETSKLISTDNVKCKNHEFYQRVLKTLCPIFHMCHLSLTSIDNTSETQTANVDQEGLFQRTNVELLNDELYSWLSDTKVIKDCTNEILPTVVQSSSNVYTSKHSGALKLSNSRTSTSTAKGISALLLLTPVLERSLGNILASTLSIAPTTEINKVPPLLRDLILNETLQRLIDSKVMVFLLHVLLGTPRSLNLRNIVWHGFASTKESDIYLIFVSTLIILIRHLGKGFLRLKDGDIAPFILQRREQVSLKRVEKIYLCFHASEIEKILNKFETEMKYVEVTNVYLDVIIKKQVIIDRCIHSYKTSNFWLALCILLPEWECLARVLFSIVNMCEERIQTAQSEALYTTFDEILSPKLFSGNENVFPKVIGTAHMELLMDLLVLPEGPRIRDKISHGEAEYNHTFIKMSVDLVMSSYLDLLSFIRRMKGRDWIAEVTEDNISSNLTTRYISQYHPTALLREDLKTALRNVDNLLPANCKLLPPSADFEWDKNSIMIFQTCNQFICKINSMLLRMVTYANKQHICNKKEGDFDSTYISEILWSCVFDKIGHMACLTTKEICEMCYGTIFHCNCASTLYRTKREYELWSINRKIVRHIAATIIKIIENLTEKMAQFEGQLLRSRQRNTYRRMLEAIPLINLTFLCLIVIMLNDLFDFYDNTIVTITIDDFSKRLKKSKKYLKMCENLAVYVGRSKNRWEESIKVVQDFMDVVTS